MIAHELPRQRLDAAGLPAAAARPARLRTSSTSSRSPASAPWAARSGPYTASKHAQLAFSRGVAAELAPRGIRIHSVNPGPVRTEGFPQNRLQGTPFERFVLEPDRVAESILRAVERGKPESFVFGAYRLFGLLQAAMPGTLVRLTARRARASNRLLLDLGALTGRAGGLRRRRPRRRPRRGRSGSRWQRRRPPPPAGRPARGRGGPGSCWFWRPGGRDDRVRNVNARHRRERVVELRDGARVEVESADVGDRVHEVLERARRRAGEEVEDRLAHERRQHCSATEAVELGVARGRRGSSGSRP